MIEQCRHQGHCFHESDGALYVRHDQRTPATVAVVCCWCEKNADAPTYAKATKAPAESSYLPREHGPFAMTGGV